MKALRHLFAASWFALVLVLGQQAVLLHGLAHATERLSQKQDSQHAPAKCDLCFACAQLSGGFAAAPLIAPTTGCTHVQSTHLLDAVVDAPLRLAFRSRAPPVSPV